MLENEMVHPNGYGITDSQEQEPEVCVVCDDAPEYYLDGEPHCEECLFDHVNVERIS